MKINLKKGLMSSMVAVSVLSVGLTLAPTVNAVELPVNHCNPSQEGTLMCDDFLGRTFFKDEFTTANWNRYMDPDGPVGAAEYINTGTSLKLQVNSLSSAGSYTNADISTNVINESNPHLRFGVNTRAEVRMRYSPAYSANPFVATNAKGSAGFLFWNYFMNPVDPEPPLSFVSHPRDAFGFSYIDAGGFFPGFKAYAVAEGQFALLDPLFTMDITQWHTYTMERRHESMTFYIDGVQIALVPLNQPGTPVLPDENGLAMDIWSDNATYTLTDPVNFVIHADYNHLDSPQWVEIQFARATQITN